jgi:hypothetical protein
VSEETRLNKLEAALPATERMEIIYGFNELSEVEHDRMTELFEKRRTEDLSEEERAELETLASKVRRYSVAEVVERLPEIRAELATIVKEWPGLLKRAQAITEPVLEVDCPVCKISDRIGPLGEMLRGLARANVDHPLLGGCLALLDKSNGWHYHNPPKPEPAPSPARPVAESPVQDSEAVPAAAEQEIPTPIIKRMLAETERFYEPGRFE